MSPGRRPRPLLSDADLHERPHGRSRVSPGRRPRPLLSAAGRSRPGGHRKVSPGRRPRPLLSGQDLLSPQERLERVSPGRRPRPLLSGPGRGWAWPSGRWVPPGRRPRRARRPSRWGSDRTAAFAPGEEGAALLRHRDPGQRAGGTRCRPYRRGGGGPLGWLDGRSGDGHPGDRCPNPGRGPGPRGAHSHRETVVVERRRRGLVAVDAGPARRQQRGAMQDLPRRTRTHSLND